MKKSIRLLNERFEGSVEFNNDFSRTIDNNKSLEIIKEVVAELNNVDAKEDKFINLVMGEINNIMKMKRLDMKTEWIITKIKQVYEYMYDLKEKSI